MPCTATLRRARPRPDPVAAWAAGAVGVGWNPGRGPQRGGEGQRETAGLGKAVATGAPPPRWLDRSKRGSPGRGGLWDGKAGELPHLPTLVVAPPRWPMAR